MFAFLSVNSFYFCTCTVQKVSMSTEAKPQTLKTGRTILIIKDLAKDIVNRVFNDNLTTMLYQFDV